MRILLIPFFFFLMALPNLTADFTSKGEAREALVVQDMLEQQDFLLPLRNGVEIPSKPPLFHWGGALLSVATDSLDEWKIRLPSALFAFLALSILGIVVERQASFRVAVLTVLLCGTSFEWLRSATLARVDMTFAACMSAALLLAYEMIVGKISPLRITTMILAFAGALLSKGPAGVAIPAIILGIYLVLHKPRRPQNFIALAAIGLCALTIGGAWYLLAYERRGMAFVEVQLMKENISRLTGAGSYEVGHEKPFFMAPVELLVAFLPWSLLLPFVALRTWRERKRLWELQGLPLLSVIATLVFLIICSIATSKRPVYFLGLLPFLSYLTAREILPTQYGWFVRRFAIFILVVGASASAFGIMNTVRNANSPAPFVQLVKQRLTERPGALFQLKREYYPFLYYFHANTPVLGSASELQPGSYLIARQGEEPLCQGCIVVERSENLADDGRNRLELIFRPRV